MDNNVIISLRLDNLYKYDTEVQCNMVDSYCNETLLYQDRIYNDDNPLIAYEEFPANASCHLCQLTGGYSVALLGELVRVLNLSLQLDSGVGNDDFIISIKDRIDLYVGLKPLRDDLVLEGNADISFPLGYSRLNVYLSHEHESGNKVSVLESIDERIWIGFLLLAMVQIIALTIIRSIVQANNRISKEPVIDTGYLIFEGVSAALQRGGLLCKHGTSSSFRIILFCLAIAFYILMVSYSASVVAIISVPVYVINSIEDLAKSKYDIIIHRSKNVTSTRLQAVMYELAETDRTIQKIIEKTDKSQHKFKTFETTLELIKNSSLAWFTWDDSGNAAINEEFAGMPCSWSKIPVGDVKFSWTFYMKKNFTYKNDVNDLFLRMAETGLMKYHQTKWVPHQTPSRCGEISVAVDMNSSYSIFMFLMCGITFSFGSLLAEKFSVLYNRLFV